MLLFVCAGLESWRARTAAGRPACDRIEPATAAARATGECRPRSDDLDLGRPCGDARVAVHAAVGLVPPAPPEQGGVGSDRQSRRPAPRSPTAHRASPATTIPASAAARPSSKPPAIPSSPTGPSASTMKVTSCAGPDCALVVKKPCSGGYSSHRRDRPATSARWIEVETRAVDRPFRADRASQQSRSGLPF